jgi:hypothetical protein
MLRAFIGLFKEALTPRTLFVLFLLLLLAFPLLKLKLYALVESFSVLLQ